VSNIRKEDIVAVLCTAGHTRMDDWDGRAEQNDPRSLSSTWHSQTTRNQAKTCGI